MGVSGNFSMKQRSVGWVLMGLLLSMLPLLSSSPRAFAQTVSAPANFNASTETFTAVSGSGTTPSISGFSGSVQVTVTSSGGNVKIQTINGLSAPTGYNRRDWNTYETSTEISFVGLQSEVSDALSSLMFKATAKGSTPSISIEAFAAGKAYDANSGHYYETATVTAGTAVELVRCYAKYTDAETFTTSTVTDDGCRKSVGGVLSSSLARRSYNGLRGYLANITTLDEHNFVRSKTLATAWIGGSDRLSEGTWIWQDGPEANQVFWQGYYSDAGASLKVRQSNVTVSGAVSGFIYGTNRFNYWSNGEPNDSNDDEDFVEFGYGGDGVGASWNDCAAVCNRTQYLIEYGDSGDTKSSASATIGVRTAPGAPTGVSASVSGDRAEVSFTAPASNGGSVITSYTATSSPGGLSGTVSQSGSGTISVSGLVSGTAYTFTVAATNAVGTSAASAASSSTTTNYSAQAVTFENSVAEALPNSSFTVLATSSIGATILYSSNTPAVCEVVGNKVSTKSSGTCTIVASSGETIKGGLTYLAASSSISFILRSANFLRPKDLSLSTPTLSTTPGSLKIRSGIFVMSRTPDASISPRYASYTIYVSGRSELTLVFSDGVSLAPWQTPWHASSQRTITSLGEITVALEDSWKGKVIYVEEFAYYESSVAGMRSTSIRT